MNLPEYVKGDSININIKFNTDLTTWKIRAKLYDHCNNSIDLHSSNDGGSATDIERIDDTIGNFILHIAKNLTTNFDDEGSLEVEIEDPNGKIYTPIPGKKTRIVFICEKIK